MSHAFPTGTVTVLGSLNMDLVVAVDHFPRPGETIAGRSFETIPGGKGLNQAVAAARSGASVRMIGAVGDDPFGSQLRALATAEGIGTEHLATATVPTGTAHIQVSADGENTIVVVPGANASARTLSPERAAVVRESAYLVVQCEVPIEFTRAAIAEGAVAVLTPAPVAALGGVVPEGVAVLVGNELEIAELGGLEGIAVPLVIETLGGDGVRWAIDGVLAGSLPARRVEVVDTTAAGDTFVGALVARLAAGAALEAAIAWAVAAASITVSRVGATSSIPTAAEVDALQRRS
jgi:ribokinase